MCFLWTAKVCTDGTLAARGTSTGTGEHSRGRILTKIQLTVVDNQCSPEKNTPVHKNKYYRGGLISKPWRSDGFLKSCASVDSVDMIKETVKLDIQSSYYHPLALENQQLLTRLLSHLLANKDHIAFSLKSANSPHGRPEATAALRLIPHSSGLCLWKETRSLHFQWPCAKPKRVFACAYTEKAPNPALQRSAVDMGPSIIN